MISIVYLCGQSRLVLTVSFGQSQFRVVNQVGVGHERDCVLASEEGPDVLELNGAPLVLLTHAAYLPRSGYPYTHVELEDRLLLLEEGGGVYGGLPHLHLGVLVLRVTFN